MSRLLFIPSVSLLKKVFAVILILIIIGSGAVIVFNVIYGYGINTPDVQKWNQIYDTFKDNGFHNETSFYGTWALMSPSASGTWENMFSLFTGSYDFNEHAQILLATEHVMDLMDMINSGNYTAEEVQHMAAEVSATYATLDANLKQNSINPLDKISAHSEYAAISGMAIADMAGASLPTSVVYGYSLQNLCDYNPFNNGDAWTWLGVAGLSFLMGW